MRILKSPLKQSLGKKCFKESGHINDNFDGHCCVAMVSALKMCDACIDYISSIRRYDISVPGRFLEGDTCCIGLVIDYCPWCAAKLPKVLDEEWAFVLQSEYSIEDPYNDEAKNQIPEDFKTDIWWKKRGL